MPGASVIMRVLPRMRGAPAAGHVALRLPACYYAARCWRARLKALREPARTYGYMRYMLQHARMARYARYAMAYASYRFIQR